MEIEQYLNRVDETSRHHRYLITNSDLVIKYADKGSGIVVERESDGLSDENIYKKIDHDPLAKASNTFTHMIYNKGVVDSITRDYMLFPNDQIPVHNKCTF